MENIYFIQKPNIPSIHHHPSFLLLSFPTQSILPSMDPRSTFLPTSQWSYEHSLAQSHPSLAAIPLKVTPTAPPLSCWFPELPSGPFKLTVSIPLSLCGLLQLNSSLKCSSFLVLSAPVSSISMVSTTKFSLENFSICRKKGNPFQGLRVDFCLILWNELSEETQVLTKQETYWEGAPG